VIDSWLKQEKITTKQGKLYNKVNNVGDQGVQVGYGPDFYPGGTVLTSAQGNLPKNLKPAKCAYNDHKSQGVH